METYENQIDEIDKKLARLHIDDRALKYCQHCGARLKRTSYDSVHKKCVNDWENDDCEPRYDPRVGKIQTHC
jgi:hypothetical protein